MGYVQIFSIENNKKRHFDAFLMNYEWWLTENDVILCKLQELGRYRKNRLFECARGIKEGHLLKME